MPDQSNDLTDIIITRLSRINGQWSKHGNRIAALFNATCRGITINGCILLESEDGQFKADGPRGVNRRNHQISTHVVDEDLQRALTEEAVAIWRKVPRGSGGKYVRGANDE